MSEKPHLNPALSVPSIMTALFVLLLLLKLTGLLAWSWGWIIAPLWMLVGYAVSMIVQEVVSHEEV